MTRVFNHPAARTVRDEADENPRATPRTDDGAAREAVVHSVGATGDEARDGGTDLLLKTRRRRPVIAFSERFGLVGIWVLVVVVFALVEPRTFLTPGTASIVFGSQSVLLVIALAALLPSVNGDFDLSLGAISSLTSMVIAMLNVQHGVPIVYACLIGVALACLIGLVNAVLVVLLDNDALIVTLGTSTFWVGIIYAVSASNTVGPVSSALTHWVWNVQLFGIPALFYYGLAFVAVLWYVLDSTPFGQRALFVGRSREVARLSGIGVTKIRIFGFTAGAGLAGVSGVLYVGTTGSADPAGGGVPLLLAAYAAVFLGATVIRPGRFNALGTAVAVYFLATGITGLQLLGAQQYVQSLFYGAALVGAVVVSRLIRAKS
jgi:ribose transport system permease protein